VLVAEVVVDVPPSKLDTALAPVLDPPRPSSDSRLDVASDVLSVAAPVRLASIVDRLAAWVLVPLPRALMVLSSDVVLLDDPPSNVASEVAEVAALAPPSIMLIRLPSCAELRLLVLVAGVVEVVAPAAAPVSALALSFA